MRASLRALLGGLIDYAGLFPPAKQPMEAAVRDYLRYRECEDGWMLGRFVCPAARLGELAAFHGEIGDRPLIVSALARGGDDTPQVLANLDADLADVAACRRRHDGRVSVDALELRLPTKEMARPSDSVALLEGVASRTFAANVTTFFEVPWADALAVRSLHVTLSVMSRRFARKPGYKLRAGGLEPAAFPSARDLAYLLERIYVALALFKATAGLHHPLPRFDAGVGARMHGFVNLFLGGALADVDPGAFTEWAELLDDDDPANFRFDDDAATWRAARVTTEQIAASRRNRYVSFGSCSFDEPRDDLRALGWL